MMRRLLPLLLMLWAAPAWAGYSKCGTHCYLADTASKADVQAAVDAAEAASGGEVQIPPGTPTYSGSYNYVSKTITKNLVIRGSGITQTIITVDMDDGYPAFMLTVNGSVYLTIRDIKFVAGRATSHGMLSIMGTSLNVLMTNLWFDLVFGSNQRGLSWGGLNEATAGGGVLSKSTFRNTTAGGQGIEFNGDADGAKGVFSGNPTFGTSNAKYVEDCTFNFSGGVADGAFDGYNGTRVVFRYNTVIGTVLGWHGPDSSTGLHSIEIYGNSFSDTTGTARAMVSNARGGTALIWGNVGDSYYSGNIILALYRACTSAGGQLGSPIPGDLCDGDSIYDGNTGGSLYGYPCYQQPGRTGVSGLVAWPIIEWNNKGSASETQNGAFIHNANLVNPECGENAWDQTTYVVEGRDYIDHETCEGVTSDFCAAWWDDANDKAANYTPYTYPHPLTARVPATIPVRPRTGGGE